MSNIPSNNGQKESIYKKYGFRDYLSLKDISTLMEISESRVSQIKTRAESKLRHKLGVILEAERLSKKRTRLTVQ